MSEYADGFDDGKGEKFDELMVEITTLREQLKDCSAAFDKQQEQLDRNAEQIAALRGLLGRAAVAVKWGINDEYDQHAKGAAAVLLQEINAALKENGK